MDYGTKLLTAQPACSAAGGQIASHVRSAASAGDRAAKGGKPALGGRQSVACCFGLSVVGCAVHVLPPAQRGLTRCLLADPALAHGASHLAACCGAGSSKSFD
ncbi:MAG: hypothetical protein WKF30_04355 [Pyrinomonadaceae bacterium]